MLWDRYAPVDLFALDAQFCRLGLEGAPDDPSLLWANLIQPMSRGRAGARAHAAGKRRVNC